MHSDRGGLNFFGTLPLKPPGVEIVGGVNMGWFEHHPATALPEPGRALRPSRNSLSPSFASLNTHLGGAYSPLTTRRPFIEMSLQRDESLPFPSHAVKVVRGMHK